MKEVFGWGRGLSIKKGKSFMEPGGFLPTNGGGGELALIIRGEEEKSPYYGREGRFRGGMR